MRSPAAFPCRRRISFLADAPERANSAADCKPPFGSDKFKSYAKRFLNYFLPDDFIVFIVRQAGRNYQSGCFDRKRKLRLPNLRSAADKRRRESSADNLSARHSRTRQRRFYLGNVCDAGQTVSQRNSGGRGASAMPTGQILDGRTDGQNGR